MADLDLTLEDVATAVRRFLLAVLPTGTEVVLGQVNRTPPPRAPNYVVMTPLVRQRLSTNVETLAVEDDVGTLSALSPGQLTLQCDVFGPASADNAAIIEATWRSSYGCAKLSEDGEDIAPLYVEPIRQMPLIDGEQQYQDRWSVDLVMQINQNVSLGQDYATTLQVGVISVDAAYPPQ